ncbi:phosphoglycerate mutase domain-containing protein [Cyclospora cayetanensis]|uniref:Phosphoglycerate mutase domain-containing protein n=1 Tax=Cyclospora cayetanensis TaxID=88456 RepID=A0A1D3CSG7_9EIME|nr:phosphoglycerate mutase domain-containing protein [Cyclospora cayetanensis]
MLRGVQTARELQKLLQVPVLIHPLLFEAGGLFEGERQAIESATSATATKVAANDAEGPQEERLGLTWEQLHEICPAAVVAPGVSWPPAEQGDASCGCLDKTALPRCGESSAASVSLGGGYSPEALRGGAPWWRGPRETFFGTLRRALLLVQWIDSWSAHAGSADGSAAPEVAEATGDEEAAAVSALKGDGALLVVGHGLLMDLLMKALVAGPAAGICSCTVLYEQERQLFEQLQHSECSLNALYMPQQQAVYFLSGNCSLSCIDVVPQLHQQRPSADDSRRVLGEANRQPRDRNGSRTREFRCGFYLIDGGAEGQCKRHPQFTERGMHLGPGTSRDPSKGAAHVPVDRRAP